MNYERISVDKDQMGGVPCVRHLRIPVAAIVAMFADGMTVDEILDAYPDIEKADIKESLHFAASAVTERQIPLKMSA